MTEPLDADEQAHLDLHAPRLVPPPIRPPDDVHQPTETVDLHGDLL